MWMEDRGRSGGVKEGQWRPVNLDLTPELWWRLVQGGQKAKSSLSKV